MVVRRATRSVSVVLVEAAMGVVLTTVGSGNIGAALDVLEVLGSW